MVVGSSVELRENDVSVSGFSDELDQDGTRAESECAYGSRYTTLRRMLVQGRFPAV